MLSEPPEDETSSSRPTSTRLSMRLISSSSYVHCSNAFWKNTRSRRRKELTSISFGPLFLAVRQREISFRFELWSAPAGREADRSSSFACDVPQTPTKKSGSSLPPFILRALAQTLSPSNPGLSVLETDADFLVSFLCCLQVLERDSLPISSQYTLLFPSFPSSPRLARFSPSFSFPSPPLELTVSFHFTCLSYIELATRQIARIATTSKIVVEKSTVPCRTAESMRTILDANSRPGVHFDILSNPEFLAEGTAIADLFAPDRVLIGSLQTEEGKKASAALSSVYANWVP